MSKGNYFARYESPNIVLVPSLSSSNDGRPTSDSCHTSAPCNLPCCNITASPMDYTQITYLANQNNLNDYSHTDYNNYNVNHDNIANTAEENDLKVTWLPQFSQVSPVENALVYTPPTFQDYAWATSHPAHITENITNNKDCVSPGNKIKINLKNKKVTDLNIIQENIHDVNMSSLKNHNKICHESEETCSKTDANLEENLKDNTTKEKNKASTNIKKVSKNRASTKTRKSSSSKLKCKVLKPKKDLKYLWKRHCAKLKDKIKQDIEGSEDLKTQLHTQWKAILRSEYNTFVKNFYRSAWISKNKIKSVIANNTLNLDNKSKTDLKTKQPVPTSSRNFELRQNNKDNRIKRSNTLKCQAPHRAYLRKQYENVDLRSILSRKRNQNCYEPQKRMPKRPRERENLVITVNQDIQTETEKPKAMEPKPKKKCKKIKLVINVVCNDSESEEDSNNSDSDHCSLFNEDLSFLDDFNVDDIVNSLNCDNLLEDSKGLQEMCTDKNISTNVSKDEGTHVGLNELSLDKTDKMDVTEIHELVAAKENDNVDCNSSAVIIGYETNDVSEKTLETHNSSVQNITATTISSLNVKTEIHDLERERTFNEESHTTNNTEFNMDHPSILWEINNVKNEFIAKIDEKQNVLTIVTKSPDYLITNESSNDILKPNGANVKSESANMETTKYTDSSEQCTKMDPVIQSISQEEKSTPDQMIVAKHPEDEIITITDDESNDESEEVNTILENKTSNLSDDNKVVVETHKKENTLDNSEETVQQVHEELVTLVEIGDGKGDINKQEHSIKKQEIVVTTTVVTTKNFEVAKEAVNSKAKDIKPSVSNEKPDVSNNIRNFEEESKIKQIKNKHTHQGLVGKLEKRMFDVIGERYNITSSIRGGKFSKVYKCTNYKGNNFALKVLNHVSDHRMKGLLKKKMLMSLQKNIPRDKLNLVYILNSFCTSGYWCFVMEYYPKNLEQALLECKKGFHINLVQELTRQLVAAVTVLTNNNIVHTDIKPSHILLNSTNDKLKLCGFDDSKYIQHLQTKPNTGTVNYRAPEIILGFLADYRIDVWATALVIFEMATGNKLFPGIFNNDILYKQISTLGEIPNDMREGSTYKHLHFINGKFIRIMDSHHRKQIIPFIKKNNRLYGMPFKSYRKHWQSFATKQEVFEDKAKLNGLQQLLEQMLVLDPRYRLPINFVGVSEFLHYDSR